MINASVGRAIATQLTRVNQSPEALQRKIEELQAIIDRQAEIIRRLRAAAAPLPACGEGTGEGLALPVDGEGLFPANGTGVGVITPAQAARKFGVSIATINRALHARRLNGWQQPNGHWLVDAKSTLVKKSRKGKK